MKRFLQFLFKDSMKTITMLSACALLVILTMFSMENNDNSSGLKPRPLSIDTVIPKVKNNTGRKLWSELFQLRKSKEKAAIEAMSEQLRNVPKEERNFNMDMHGVTPIKVPFVFQFYLVDDEEHTMETKEFNLSSSDASCRCVFERTSYTVYASKKDSEEKVLVADTFENARAKFLTAQAARSLEMNSDQ